MASAFRPCTMPERHPFSKRILRGAVSAAFWITLWQLLSLLVGKELLVPQPLTVWRALAVLASTVSFWASIGASVLRILLGFLFGVLCGSLIACATSFSKTADLLLTPAVALMRSVPVVSFIILALIWLKADLLPGVISGLMVIPILWGNVSQGIRSTSPQLLEMAQTYRLSPLRTLRAIYLPSVRPYFLSACITALGNAWKAGVAAEVLCQPKLAIGTGLYHAKIYLETADLFAWTFVVILLSFLVEFLLKKLFQKIGGESV